ncbi:MAG TPA: hypothetical protein VFY50_01880 [Candidatus Nitrosocosmicus sp.]|nr:hypothetical protein [Candidatus Nitrosocosmicus sp.]
MFLANGGISISQYANAQSPGDQFGDTIGGALNELGEGLGNVTETGSEAVSNATQGMSGAANETGQAADNATTADESASQAASETGQAADNATSTGGNATNSTSQNPLDMLMNLFK